MSKSAPHIALIYLALILLVSSSVFSQKVRLRSSINPDCGVNSNLKFADIYGDGNIAVQGTYACRGVFIYDISDPDAPALASWYNPSAPGGTTKLQFLEAIVVGNRGYFGIGGPTGGVHIVDLTDPRHPALLGVVDSAHGNGHETVHEMLVWGKYLIENYNSTAEKRIKIIDISNPAAPTLKWEFSPADSGWIHNMHIRGNRMFTSEYVGSKVEIYDVSNLDTQPPQLLGAVQSDSTNHSTWTSEDGNYLYSCRETADGDLRVYDVRDPSQPLLIKAIKAKDLGLNAISPHNPVVMGNKLYVSWYQAGLQVFDISNPADPVRLGQYDTYQPAFNIQAAKSSLLEEPENAVCGFSAIQNSLPNTYDGMWAVYPFLGENKILTGDLASGLAIFDVTKAGQPLKNCVSDFDGDGHTDLSVYSPASGTWSIEQSSTSALSATNWGASSDLVEPGDFDGDGRADIAVWRPSNGTWYIARSSGGFALVPWGAQNDVPVAADYDADGKTDIAVWRPSTGTWYILRSTLGLEVLNWGTSGDKPLTGDYDGDGKPDIGIFRPSTGTWYIIESSSSQVLVENWGIATDLPVVADFDNDGIADIGVFRPSNGTWYVINSASGSFTIIQFGAAGDIPVPADYDGDSKADLSVYRPAANTWYTLNSTNGAFIGRNFGSSNDTAVPSSAQPF